MTVFDSGVAAVSTTRPKSANSSVENGLHSGMQVCSCEDRAVFTGSVQHFERLWCVRCVTETASSITQTSTRSVAIQALERAVGVVFGFLFEFVSVSTRAYAR